MRRRRRQEKSNGGGAGLRRGEVSGGGGVGRERRAAASGTSSVSRGGPDASAPWPASTSTASIRPQPEDLEPRSAASIGTRTRDLPIGGGVLCGVPPDVEGEAYRANAATAGAAAPPPPPWCRLQRALHLQLREGHDSNLQKEGGCDLVQNSVEWIKTVSSAPEVIDLSRPFSVDVAAACQEPDSSPDGRLGLSTIQHYTKIQHSVRLDLKQIVLHACNAEYNPKRFVAVIMRIRDPKTTALIFASGKMVQKMMAEVSRATARLLLPLHRRPAEGASLGAPVKELKNPLIFIHAKKISNMNSLLPLILMVMGRPRLGKKANCREVRHGISCRGSQKKDHNRVATPTFINSFDSTSEFELIDVDADAAATAPDNTMQTTHSQPPVFKRLFYI